MTHKLCRISYEPFKVYARAHNHENQLELIDHVAALFIQEPEAFKLLIIDSIIAMVNR